MILYLLSVAFANKVFPLKIQVKRGNGDPRALQNNWTFIPLFAAAFRVNGVFVISGLTAHKSTRKSFITCFPIHPYIPNTGIRIPRDVLCITRFIFQNSAFYHVTRVKRLNFRDNYYKTIQLLDRRLQLLRPIINQLSIKYNYCRTHRQ